MLADCTVIHAEQLQVKQKYAWRRAALIQRLLPVHHISGDHFQLLKCMSCHGYQTGLLSQS